jgi:hypothetical protein
MKHYTYKLTQEETGLYYIGVRSCKCEIKDDPYMGSMQAWKLTKEEKLSLKKEIIAVYSSREEANEDEHFILKSIKRDWKDPNCMNGHDGKSFCMLGYKHTEEVKNLLRSKSTGVKQSKETIEKRCSKIRGTVSKLKGTKIPENQRLKIVKSLTGSSNHMYGKSHTIESKDKIRETRRINIENGSYIPGKPHIGKKWYTNGIDSKLYVPGTEPSDFYKGRIISDEQKLKISNTLKNKKNI